MSKRLIVILISLFIITSCSSTSVENNNKQETVYENEIALTDTSIDVSKDLDIYSSPDDNGNVVGKIGKGSSINAVSKIEADDYVWYKINDNNWIKIEQNSSSIQLIDASNWEEMVVAMTNGYWLIVPDYDPKNKQDSGICQSWNIVKYHTINLGLETDRSYNDCPLNGKGIGVSYVLRSNYGSVDYSYDAGAEDYFDQLLNDNDDVNNKKAHFLPASCRDGYDRSTIFDYSNINNGIVKSEHEFFVCYGMCLSSNGCIPNDYVSLSYIEPSKSISHENKVVSIYADQYYYPTIEEALEAFGDGIMGEIEVLANVVNVRDIAGINPHRDNKVGKVKKGEKYKVYAIDESLNDESYVWYQIGDNQWVADDGTWMKYTPKEFKYN